MPLLFPLSKVCPGGAPSLYLNAASFEKLFFFFSSLLFLSLFLFYCRVFVFRRKEGLVRSLYPRSFWEWLLAFVLQGSFASGRNSCGMDFLHECVWLSIDLLRQRNAKLNYPLLVWIWNPEPGFDSSTDFNNTANKWLWRCRKALNFVCPFFPPRTGFSSHASAFSPSLDV